MPILKNPKHELFAQERAKGATEIEAHKKAGYTGNRGNAAEINANQSVQARIAELQTAGAKQAVVTLRRVLIELKRIAFVDISSIYDKDGELLKPADMPAAVRRAIAGVETVTEFEQIDGRKEAVGYTKKVRLWDKVKALELLLRHLGAVQDDDKKKGLEIVLSIRDYTHGTKPT